MSDVDAAPASSADAGATGQAPTQAPSGGQPASGAAPASNPGDWFSSLPDTLKADSGLGKFVGKPLEEVVGAYLSAQRLIGVDPSNLLRVDEAQKDPGKALARLGAPESPAGYQLAPPEGTPEHLASGENLTWFKELATRAKLLPSQAEQIFKEYVSRSVEMQQAVDGEVAKAKQSLQLELGKAYDQTIQQASSAARALGIKETLESAGLGADPGVIKALAKVSALMGETGGPGGSVQNAGILPPDQAEAKAWHLTREARKAQLAGDKETSERLLAESRRHFAMLGD